MQNATAAAAQADIDDLLGGSAPNDDTSPNLSPSKAAPTSQPPPTTAPPALPQHGGDATHAAANPAFDPDDSAPDPAIGALTDTFAKQKLDDNDDDQLSRDAELARSLQQAESAGGGRGDLPPPASGQVQTDEELAKSLQEEERRAAIAAEAEERAAAGVDPSEEAVGVVASTAAMQQQQMSGTLRRLTVTVVQAKLTKAYGLLTKMDPYCKIRIGHVVLTTPTMTGGATNPRWNKTFQCILPPGVEAFDVEIYDERVLMSDALIAQATIAIPEQVLNGDTKEDWWPLSGQQGEGKEGVIELVLSYQETQGYSGGRTSILQPSTVAPVAAPSWSAADVKQLHEMFPTMEEEIIRSVITQTRGNKEEAINSLLAMSS